MTETTLSVPVDPLLLTPVMQQYLEAKRRHPEAILFFRLGDFYEMFFEDAEQASKLLGLALTSRHKGPDAVPMAGVPFHAVNTYLRRLLEAGRKVAICEQVSAPETSKGLVERRVTRVLTPGTVIEEDFLAGKRHNYLAAIYPADEGCGLAWTDVSTGQLLVAEVPLERIPEEMAALAPSECLAPHEIPAAGGLTAVRQLDEDLGGAVARRDNYHFSLPRGHDRLLKQFGLATLQGYGLTPASPAVGAAGALLQYLEEMYPDALRHLKQLARVNRDDAVRLDRSTRECLELTETMRHRGEQGTLVGVLDRCRTTMGSRLLREWLLHPLKDVAAIQDRQQGVLELVDRRKLREEVGTILEGVRDVERILARVSCGRGNGRDLLCVRDALAAADRLKKLLGHPLSPRLTGLAVRLWDQPELRELVTRTLVEEPPLAVKDGGMIRPGLFPELDELRAISRDGKAEVAGFQAREAERTGIGSLKVGYNRVFGYYLEVTNVHQEKVPPEYTRKQTLKNCERYVTPELKSFEEKILTAEERAKAREYEIFEELCGQVLGRTREVQELAQTLAELDVLGALATVAVERRYVLPRVEEGRELHIVEGRHPVLEAALGDREFVPNDVHLTPAAHLVVLTGPNMAGKSTYIRQVALITLLAQIGSFVPAREAVVGVVDGIYTRIGSADEIARGRSTFMVEMTETAHILHHATDRSLIILDEVGRGTSTFDGISIAWAVTEHLCRRVKARTLFATHYHELTEISLMFPEVRNFNVAVKEWGDKVIFLRKIVAGGSDKSYGLHVARLAGLPREVVERASEVLGNLERESLDLKSEPKRARTRSVEGGASAGKKPYQKTLFAHPSEAVVEALKDLDLDHLTPLAALNKLQELKHQLGHGLG